MFYVYIIQAREGRYYIGSTENILKRIEQHNSKKFKGWTNRFNDWKLVYYESFLSRTEAIKRERQIKRMKGGTAFKKLIGS